MMVNTLGSLESPVVNTLGSRLGLQITLENSKKIEILGMSDGTRRSCLLKKKQSNKCRDTVPLSSSQKNKSKIEQHYKTHLFVNVRKISVLKRVFDKTMLVNFFLSISILRIYCDPDLLPFTVHSTTTGRRRRGGMVRGGVGEGRGGGGGGT